MAHTSTLTLLGQSEAAAKESATKMTKTHLDVSSTNTTTGTDGLRCREKNVLLDENNNVSSGKEQQQQEVNQATSSASKMHRMWGFFNVDQPVKTLNSIMIPLAHLLCIYALGNITLATMWKTIAFGESH